MPDDPVDERWRVRKSAPICPFCGRPMAMSYYKEKASIVPAVIDYTPVGRGIQRAWFCWGLRAYRKTNDPRNLHPLQVVVMPA